MACRSAFLTVLILFAIALNAQAIDLAPVTDSVNFHMKYDESFGGISLRNRDFVDYVVEVDWVDAAIHLSYSTLTGHEGNILPSGKYVILPVRTGPWKIVGDTGREIHLNATWGAVAGVELAPYGDDNAVGLEGRIDGAAVPLMHPIHRAPENMPHYIEPPVTHAPPIRHAFGLRDTRAAYNYAMERMKKEDPERYNMIQEQARQRRENPQGRQ